MSTYPAESIILKWYCPRCDIHSEQYLSDIAEVGTAICEECGDDMLLGINVELLPYSQCGDNIPTNCDGD